MLLTASEISGKRSLQWWFCLRAQATREHLAAAYPHQYTEVEVFCPRVRSESVPLVDPYGLSNRCSQGTFLLDLTTQLFIDESGKDAAFAVLSIWEIALGSWLTN